MKHLWIAILIAIFPIQSYASIAAGTFLECRANPAFFCTSASHTISGSNNAGVVTGYWLPSQTAKLTSCTWNGSAMSDKSTITDSTANRGISLFYITAPTTGVVTCNAAASVLVYHSDENYTGVSQTGQPIASTTNKTTATTMSITLGGLTVILNQSVSSYLSGICAQVNAVSGNDWLLCAAGVEPAGTNSAGANTSIRGFDSDARSGVYDSNDTAGPVTVVINGVIALVNQAILYINQSITKL